MHHLEPISFVEASFSPAIPRDNRTIQFYRHAIGFHPEDFHKGGESERGGNITEIPLVPIDTKFHVLLGDTMPAGHCYSALRNTNFRVEVRPS